MYDGPELLGDKNSAPGTIFVVSNLPDLIMARGRPRKDDGVYFDDGIELTQGDEEIHFSFDGMRALTGLTNLRPEKRQHVAAKELPEVDEKLAHWTPVPDTDLDEVDAHAFSVSSLAKPPQIRCGTESTL